MRGYRKSKHAFSSYPNKLQIFWNKYKLSKLSSFLMTLLITLLLFFPILWMVRMSISFNKDLFKFPPKWASNEINYKGYLYFFKNAIFRRFYLNSIIVSSSTVCLCLFVGILAGYSFSRFDYRGRKTLMIAVLSAQMFPWALMIITLYIFFSKIRLIDTYWALILAHSSFGLPLTIWITKSYFDTIPRELDESAYIDGCGRLTVLSRIILPLSSPGVLAASIYVFVRSWNDFLFGLTLTTSTEMRTIAPGILLSFVGQFEYRWVEMMASAIIISTPIIIAFLFLQKYFVQGLTAGALKE